MESSAGFIVFKRQENNILFLVLEGLSGNWGFPKGHLDEGETAIEAAKRELYEETGIKNIIQYQFEESIEYAAYDNPKKVTYYLCESYDPCSISGEHLNYKWCKFDEAYKLIKWDNIRELFTKSLENINKIQLLD